MSYETQQEQGAEASDSANNITFKSAMEATVAQNLTPQTAAEALADNLVASVTSLGADSVKRRLKATQLAANARGAMALKAVMSVNGQAGLAVNDITDLHTAAIDSIRAILDNLHGALVMGNGGVELVNMNIDALSRMAAAAKEER